MRSSNPALRDSVFRKAHEAAVGPPMSIDGAVGKTALLLLAVTATASISWGMFQAGNETVGPIAIGSSIVALIMSFVIGFKPNLSPYLALPFAGLQGLALGAVSAYYAAAFPAQQVGGETLAGSIVFQAVLGTLAVSLSMLALYALRIIKVTAKLRAIAFAGFGAIFLVYMATLVLGLFGVSIPMIHEGGPIGIGFSLLVIGIMALNLLVDFDFIERGAHGGLPKYMEWYGAFALLVTLIWMYYEFLRLLAKLRSSD